MSHSGEERALSGDTMRAVVIGTFGDADVLEVRDVERPSPGRGEVRVKVAASGVNRADLLQRRGAYPAPPGEPQDIPGLEFAGEVEALGPGCSGELEVGRPVMGIVGGGGYAEHVVIPEGAAVPVPGGLSMEEAGAVPEVFMTAFDALVRQVRLTAGETLLVHAAGSGVGTAAIQLARAAGARTVGTSRTPDKLRRAQDLGLDVAVEGGDGGWPDAVLEATGGRGVDVILDLVGAAYLPGNQRVLASGGRWIVVGVPGGARGEIDLSALMRRRANLTGTVLRSRPLEEKLALAADFRRRALPLFADGRLVPVLDRAFPAREAPAAHRRMEANLNFGKLVLTW